MGDVTAKGHEYLLVQLNGYHEHSEDIPSKHSGMEQQETGTAHTLRKMFMQRFRNVDSNLQKILCYESQGQDLLWIIDNL